MNLRIPLEKIISGGQTGVDRAALDFALEHGIPCGGWCPKGRLAEDGVIPNRYPLKETPSEDYAQRTEWNARDADLTVIFTEEPVLEGGSLWTAQMAAKHRRKWVHIPRGGEGLARLREALAFHRPKVLNVAGPRESKAPDLGKWVKRALSDALLAPQEVLNS